MNKQISDFRFLIPDFRALPAPMKIPGVESEIRNQKSGIPG
jgi:hypothetical protein